MKEQLNTLQLKYEKADNEEQGESMWKEKAKQLENEVSAMEEMLSSLTEQKLHYTMEVRVLYFIIVKSLLILSGIKELRKSWVSNSHPFCHWIP